jgi:PAS domain S-box-containing protein
LLVKELLRKDVAALSPQDSVARAARVLALTGVNCLPLVDRERRPVGVVGIHEVMAAMLEPHGSDAPLERIMERSFRAVGEESPFDFLEPRASERMVVVDQEGRYSGVVTKLDLIMGLNACLGSTQSQLEAVLESVPSGIIAVDAQEALTLVNPKAEEILGHKAADILGRRVGEVIPDSGLPRVMRSAKAEFGLPYAWGDKFLLVSRSPILGPEGVVGGVSVFHDASELVAVQKQLEELRRLNDELSSLIEGSHDGVIITDHQRILKVNASFGRISGLAPEALENRRVDDLDASRHVCLASVQEIFRLVRHHRKSMTVLRKLHKGNEIYVTGSPVFDSHGQVAKLVLNIRDVTELSRLEDQIRRLSAAYLAQPMVCQPIRAMGEEVVAESRAMRNLLDMVVRVAKVDSTVLLEGESGVGKDVLARVIHSLSSRHRGPFVAVNCGAIPENLLESEFFGYEKGAFTGAGREGKPGLFEQANGGILFLDEVGELPLALQVKLLKVIQDQKCQRLGGLRVVETDVRILAATNRRLRDMVAQGLFRQDLFYRLYVVPIHVPPLRERREDILPLALMFLRHFNQKYEVSRTLGHQLLRVLESYSWPGNVRELRNVVERLVVTADSETLEPRHLPESIRPTLEATGDDVCVNGLMDLKQAKEKVERELIARALSSGGNTREAARLLGIDHSTVVRKAQRYGLAPAGARISEV